MTEEMRMHKQHTFEVFIKTVLRNKARNLHKRLNTMEQHEATASDFETEAFSTAAYEDTYQLETPQQFIVNGQMVLVLNQQLGQAITYLHPKYRSILLLSFFAQWSDSLIAKNLHLPISTVHDRKQQALRQLKAQLEVQYGT